MTIHSITRLRIRAWYDVPLFLAQSLFSIRQSRRAGGNLGVALLQDAHRVFWTRTAWRDEVALKAFMMGGAHARAMPRLVAICDEASVVRWAQEDDTPPSWAEAHRRMVTEGRRSRLRHPSPAHEAYEIAVPSVTSRGIDFGRARGGATTVPAAGRA